MTVIFIAIIVFITIKAFLYKIALEQSILVFREYIKRHHIRRRQKRKSRSTQMPLTIRSCYTPSLSLPIALSN